MPARVERANIASGNFPTRSPQWPVVKIARNVPTMSDVQQIMKLAIVVTIALVLSGNGDAAIVYPKATDGGQAMVSEFSGHFLRRKDPRFLDGFGLEELTIAEPYRIYDVELTNLSSGHLLSAATTMLGRARPPGLWT